MSDNQLTFQKIAAAQKLMQHSGIIALIPPPLWSSEPPQPYVESFRRTAVEARHSQRAFDRFVTEEFSRRREDFDRSVMQALKFGRGALFGSRALLRCGLHLRSTWSARRRKRAKELHRRKINQLKTP